MVSWRGLGGGGGVLHLTAGGGGADKRRRASCTASLPFHPCPPILSVVPYPIRIFARTASPLLLCSFVGYFCLAAGDSCCWQCKGGWGLAAVRTLL